MKTITIEGQLRTEFGKKATRQIRSEGNVPAVIYGGAKEINFQAPSTAFKGIVYTPDFMKIEIMVDGSSYHCVLKDLQFDKVTEQLIHADFQELIPGKKIKISIPLDFIGTPKGVKDQGGRLVEELKALKVKVDPDHLRDHIAVDISDLKINDKIRVQDITAENMEILNSPRIPVVSVTTTRLVLTTTAAETPAEDDTAAAAAPAPEAAAAPAESAKK